MMIIFLWDNAEMSSIFLKGIQYKNFMQLWNHKQVVLSKIILYLLNFIAILINFVAL